MSAMNHRLTRGTTLIEALVAVAIGAIALAGAAAHFRTLRQVASLTNGRREALQNGRIALERLARRIRTAKQITAITAETDTAGSITILDFDDVSHVFSLVGTEVRCGVDAPSDVLATGIDSLRFQGYGAGGAVPSGEPAGIDAVQISIAASVPASSETAPLTTWVRLRREVGFNHVRSTTSYATAYETTMGSGLNDPQRAYDAPDDLYARCRDGRGGMYFGFATGSHTGPVSSIHAALRMQRRAGWLQIIIRHDQTKLFDETYTDDDLKPVHKTWGWWWIDITALRADWTEADIDNLSIEVRDPGPESTDMRFDSLAIYALFDPAVSTTFWADRQGAGECPNEWTNPLNATGEPDDQFATGHWLGEDRQSYAFPVPDSRDWIVSFHVRIECYLPSAITDDDLEVRVGRATAGKDDGTKHEFVAADLAPYVGYANRGTLLVDVTNDRDWVWDDLQNYEVRFRLDEHGSADTTLEVDAVAWVIRHHAPPGKGIRIWSEP